MLYVLSIKEVPGGEDIGGVYVGGQYHQNEARCLMIKGKVCCYEKDDFIKGVSEEGLTEAGLLKAEFLLFTATPKKYMLLTTN